MSVKNSTKSRRKFDDSFKQDVLKMGASGRPVLDIAQALGISASLIHRWNRVSRSASANSVSSNYPSTTQQTSLSAENERLKAELRRTEQERDILKKLP